MDSATLTQKLGELDALRAELLGQLSRKTSTEKIQALAAAQPHVKPKTKALEALLMSGYGFGIEEAGKIVAERDKDPQAWPLTEYRKAQAMLEAYEAKPRVISTRVAWHRTRG